MWRNDAIMHDVEHVKCGAAMLCKMWCDMRDVALCGTMRDVGRYTFMYVE